MAAAAIWIGSGVAEMIESPVGSSSNNLFQSVISTYVDEVGNVTKTMASPECAWFSGSRLLIFPDMTVCS